MTGLEAVLTSIMVGILGLWMLALLVFSAIGGGLLLYVLFLFTVELRRDILR